jgi:anti-anti-sigma regulatory factor
MRFEVLKVVWRSEHATTIASLVGPVDAHASDVIDGLHLLASDVPNLVIDLAGVNYVDADGIALLEPLTERANVGIVNVSSAVQIALERLGEPGP